MRAHLLKQSIPIMTLMLSWFNHAAIADEGGPFVGTGMVLVSFDNGELSGTSFNTGLTIGGRFLSQYEIGLNYTSSELLPFGLIGAKLDQSSDDVLEDELEVSSRTLYGKMYLTLTRDTSAFALVGSSKYSLKNRKIGFNPLFFTFSSNVSYRSRGSATAFGVGIRTKWRSPSGNHFVSFQYLDHSNGSFDFSTIHFGWDGFF